MKMFFGVDISAVRKAGVRRGPTGGVTSVQYKTKIDGDISFYEAGWRKFMTGNKRLRVDTPVIIAIRNSNRNDLHMMVLVNHV